MDENIEYYSIKKGNVIVYYAAESLKCLTSHLVDLSITIIKRIDESEARKAEYFGVFEADKYRLCSDGTLSLGYPRNRTISLN